MNKKEDTCHSKSKNVFLIGDRHSNSINIQSEVKGDWVCFKCFPGANSKQLDYYSIPMVVEEKPNTTIIHVASNDIKKLNYHIINADESAKGIVHIGLKFKHYRIGQVTTSSFLARSNNDLIRVIKQVHISVRSLYKAYGFAFIYNENSDRNWLWRDGIHFRNEGMSLLFKNLLEYLNRFFHQNMDFSVNCVNKTWLELNSLIMKKVTRKN